jgi:hypothetical protein
MPTHGLSRLRQASSTCMRWGQPKRRTALGLDAEVRITSVRNGSALFAEDDATSASWKNRQMYAVRFTEAKNGQLKYLAN